jgi:hypothetical protein
MGMASIEEVKAGLGQAAERGGASVGQIRGAADSVDQMLVRLRAVAAGTNHPKVTEAVARAEQSKRLLAEAATTAQAAAQAARDYIGILG